jgi:hypothetical protein
MDRMEQGCGKLAVFRQREARNKISGYWSVSSAADRDSDRIRPGYGRSEGFGFVERPNDFGSPPREMPCFF